MRLGKFGGLLFFLGAFGLANYVYGQSNCSYLVINLGGYTQAEIDQAFGNADLDAYRLKTQRRSMKFANGAEVQLYGATELQGMGCQVNGTVAMEDNTPIDADRRFVLQAGYIVEPVQAVYKR